MALDDILNEFFGEDEEKSNQEEQTAQAAVPEVEDTPTAPAEPVPAQAAAPAAPAPPAPTLQPAPASVLPTPEPPAQPVPGAAPRNDSTPQPAVQPPFGAYPQQMSPTPPAPAAPSAPTTPAAPKKKNKALIMLAIIAVVCIVVTMVGLGVANAGHSGDDSRDSSSLFDDFEYNDDEEDKESGNNEDATVSVKGSDEAAKKDDDGNLTVAGVAAEAKSSCVGITVYTEQNAYSYFYSYGQQQNDGGKTASGEGSGVIMSEANGKTYIMTCAHVIADGSSFTVTLDDDTEYEATFVGSDSQTDIGVLSIEATGLQVAEFGDSEDIEVGEDCVAIGCPGGLQFKNSVTKGIVSALAVPVKSSIGYSNECIQVDAAINPGNSGGALFNMQGQVIGINSSKIASTDYEGMGFAVPSNTAVETANSLIANGYVAGRAKLGIRYNTLQNFDSAQSILKALSDKGYENATGTMVIQEIDADSNLNGKVEQYDMIVAVNGETLTSTDVLTSVLAKSKPGDTVTLTIARVNGNSLDIFDVECELIESK